MAAAKNKHAAGRDGGSVRHLPPPQQTLFPEDGVAVGDIQVPPLEPFAPIVMQWQKRAGRHHLPWQGTRDPYRIWLSEIMLQQTQVSAVIGYYQRFLERFPDIRSLAAASQDEVMPYWAGLGYYARARNLHRCAQEIIAHWNGSFPPTAEQISTLPGIGRSTAAAIAAFAYGERSPIMDGNVRRVFCRYFGIDGPTGKTSTEAELWETAERIVAAAPASLDMAAYTQGLMDLGATVCTRGMPDCAACPLNTHCIARQTGRQTELPVPRQKKAVPERHCSMLVLVREGQVLLEQRPSPGIWGGLWSLPQFDDAEALASACAAQGLPAANAQRMAGLLHVFTHFRLHIDPWLLQATVPVLQEAPAGKRWTPLDALEQAALPAPVRKILEGIVSTLR